MAAGRTRNPEWRELLGLGPGDHPAHDEAAAPGEAEDEEDAGGEEVLDGGAAFEGPAEEGGRGGGDEDGNGPAGTADGSNALAPEELGEGGGHDGPGGGEVIASDVIHLNFLNQNSDLWTSTLRFGKEVPYMAVYWRDTPDFNSLLSNWWGPRISTNFIGESFTEFRYVPVFGNYKTVFPDGKTIVVRYGSINVNRSTALTEGNYSFDGNALIFDAPYAVEPGMRFVTKSRWWWYLRAKVKVVEGVNFHRGDGSLFVRMKAQAGTPRPAPGAEPNLFEVRVTLGSGEGETAGSASLKFGDGEDAIPWSHEGSRHKKYRP